MLFEANFGAKIQIFAVLFKRRNQTNSYRLESMCVTTDHVKKGGKKKDKQEAAFFAKLSLKLFAFRLEGTNSK